MFANCRNLENFEIKTWDISELTTVASMFNGCMSLKSVELHGWNTSNVITNIDNMFNNCHSLKEISLPDMNFTQDVFLNSMFANCFSLSSLDISGWHIKRIRSFDAFLKSCYRLGEVDLSSWTVDSGALDSGKALNSVFFALTNCKSIRVSFELELANAVSATSLLASLDGIEYIDIRNWDLSKCTTNITLT